jgi:3-oxoacyl-[acyl-carrier protein] reductase
VENKVVIITGGAAGIGRATVERFARAGARVAIWDVDGPRGTTLAERLEEEGSTVRFDRVNVANAESVDRHMAAVTDAWGRVDVLVNNAGIVRDAQLVKYKDGALAGTMSDEAWDSVIGVNLKGVFLCTRAAVPHMVAAGGGVVLNASSIVGLHGNFGQTNYAATKGGVITMTRTWARELGRFRIRVNCVAPGFIATDIVNAMPQKVLDAMVQHTPLGRMGRPEDIAEVYYWLATDAAGFVHGAIINVDGGLVIGT